MRKSIFFLALMVVMSYCREPFEPDFVTGQNDFLVVEGFIHIGTKAVTQIKLSRVAPLESTGQVFEQNATVEIENESGNKFLLQQNPNGIYRSDSLSLDPNGQYRLLITTQNGKRYASEPTGVKATPPIDSVHWRLENSFVNIYVNAHDDEDKTHYYKWDYIETYEIHSDYMSEYTWKDNLMQLRNAIEKFNMFRCWKTVTAKGLEFASTVQLEEDKIKYQLLSLSPYMERFDFRYSVLIEQRALSKEEFEYLEIIEKNSTITGSLFDPMPSEIYGNVKALDTSEEHVVGFISAYTTSSERIFIYASELDIVPPPKCEIVEVEESNYEGSFGPSGQYTPITLGSPGTVLAAGQNCMDCRLQGGNPNEPDFW